MTTKYGVKTTLDNVQLPLTEDMIPDQRVAVTFLQGRKKLTVTVPFCPFCGKVAAPSEVTSSDAT